MKYILILAVVAILFFIFKNKIKNKILNSKKIDDKKVNLELVYVPIVSSRTFDFTIQIDEIGGGKAEISVIKKKVEK